MVQAIRRTGRDMACDARQRHQKGAYLKLMLGMCVVSLRYGNVQKNALHSSELTHAWQ